MKIKATDTDGEVVKANLLTYGTVTEVTANDGKVGLLLADGRSAQFEDSYGVRVNN
jgi:hypothetical protein